MRLTCWRAFCPSGTSALMSQPLKLYYSPGACSLVTHIALEEAGAVFEPLRIPIAEGGHLTPQYLAVNPHARLPALGSADRIRDRRLSQLGGAGRPCARSPGCRQSAAAGGAGRRRVPPSRQVGPSENAAKLELPAGHREARAGCCQSARGGFREP